MATRLYRVARRARSSGLLQRLNTDDAAIRKCSQMHGNAAADLVLGAGTRLFRTHPCSVLADAAANSVNCRQLLRPIINTVVEQRPLGKMSTALLPRSLHPAVPGTLPVPGKMFVRGLSNGVGPKAGIVEKVKWRMEDLHARTIGRAQQSVQNARATVTANLIRPVQKVYVDSGLSSVVTPASKVVVSASKAVVRGPLTVLESYAKGGSAAAKRVASIQLTALWQRYYLAISTTGVLVVVTLLWKTMVGAASLFVNVSEGLAHFGLLGLALSGTMAAGLYWRARVTINPDALYRRTMRTLNAAPGLLEVMGAPIAGSDIRAYVLSGGGVKLRDLRPGLSTHRAHMICAVHGSEHKGVVSVAAKKRHGKYVFKLLAIDIPTAPGKEQRIFLEGGPAEYAEAGGLIGTLRDPLVKAIAAQPVFEKEDEAEDAAEESEAARVQAEAERKAQLELEQYYKEKDQRLKEEMAKGG